VVIDGSDSPTTGGGSSGGGGGALHLIGLYVLFWLLMCFKRTK
jgi:hypothetical protein